MSQEGEGLGRVSATEALHLPLSTPPSATQGAEPGPSTQQAATQGGVAFQMGFSDRETALTELERDGWLAKFGGGASQRVEYTLGVRAVLELGHQLLVQEEGVAAGTRAALETSL